MTEEIIMEVLKWLGGGGVALIGVFLTSRKNKSDTEFSIINELQEENIRKEDRLDKQDEKINELMTQMDEMRASMFEIQTDKHRSEVKNIELQSKNERLESKNIEMANKIEDMTQEKKKIRLGLEKELNDIRNELNKKIDILIKENEYLKSEIRILRENQKE